MIELKPYQQDSLDALKKFLKLVINTSDVKHAYEEFTLEEYKIAGVYNDMIFEEEHYKKIPYVCMRLPTGGGKTILASATVPLVCKEYLDRDYLMVIWLVPTTAILEQTYNCLNDRFHPYRKVLDDAFEGNIRILKVEDAQNITKADLETNVNIIVSTYASYRVDRVEGRKVYRENGSLAEHFTENNINKGKELQCYKGTARPIPSLVNLINMNQPVLIIDEAHNARTDLTFDTLERLNPSCIVEYTATPKTGGTDRSNVLFRVSAATLKAEKMIKMPIELLTNEDWQVTVNNAVQKQRELEEFAKIEEAETGEYIRPIVLLQAEHDSQKTSTINVTEVKSFLTNDCKIPQSQIAIATGEEKGIEGKNLNEKDEPIRFIITKQALKEGWDCPFAYVFCSVANISSSKDVEQLLGRVLRMPNVVVKKNNELNKAYAFVASENFYQTAMNLQDSLTQGGFDAKEASELIEVSSSQQNLGEFFGLPVRTFTNIPANNIIPKDIREKLEINRSNNTITIKQPITASDRDELKNVFTDENDKVIIEQIYEYTNKIIKASESPQRKGMEFKIPQLVLEFGGEERIFDEESLILPGWNLTNCIAKLTEKDFPIKIEAGDLGLLDLDEKGNVQIFHSEKTIQVELSSLIVSSRMDKQGLIKWLTKECRHQAVPYPQSIKFISDVVDNLIEEKHLSVDQLVYKRMKLREALNNKISFCFQTAKENGYQTLLFGKDPKYKFKLSQDFLFPQDYPVNNSYQGTYNYKKHFYGTIGDMNGEEAECAFYIDSNPNVEFWVRNLERKEDSSFWLQTGKDKFYPDFVVKLNNGIIVLIEYKGEVLYSNKDSEEKRLLGDFYAYTSQGLCKFIMLNGRDWKSLNELLKNA